MSDSWLFSGWEFGHYEVRSQLSVGRQRTPPRHPLTQTCCGSATRRLTILPAIRAVRKNKKHTQQWENTLATYAYRILGKVDVRNVDTPIVVRVVRPIWLTKPETASRVRGRFEAILDTAKALGKRSGEKPARWRGHLDKILPKRPGSSSAESLTPSKTNARRTRQLYGFGALEPFSKTTSCVDDRGNSCRFPLIHEGRERDCRRSVVQCRMTDCGRQYSFPPTPESCH